MNRLHRWYCRTDRWANALHDEIMPWALRDLEPGDDVLEVGPGPGLTTDRLCEWAPRLTAIEIDPSLSDSLRNRLPRVEVVTGDATAMPFPDGRFSAVVSFTMLHHVPSGELQDALLGQVHRVLRPGGTFAGSDSRSSTIFRLAHLFDTMVLVDPDTFAQRLESAGFGEIEVRSVKSAFRFRARRAKDAA